MLSLYKYIIAFSVPMSKNLFQKKVDINIACYENILGSKLTWQQRENVYEKLSSLYYYRYILQNVQNARVNILPDELLCYENTTEGDDNGWWYFEYDF